MPLKSALLAVLVAALWGGNFIAVKLASRDFSPLFLLALRFAPVVAAVMLPFVPRPRRDQWGAVAAVSVALGGLHFGLMFVGLTRLEASTASVIIQLEVPFSTLLAVLLFKETLGWRRILGIAVAFAGVVVLAGAPELAEDGLGMLLVLGAGFAWAVANAILKRYGPLDPKMMTAWMALLAVPQLLLVSLLLEDGQWQSLFAADWIGWSAMLYTVVGSTLIAYTLWYHLINIHPVTQVVPYTLLVPVFAIAGAVLALGEALTPLLILGAVLTVGGVALCELRFPRWGSAPRAPVQ